MPVALFSILALLAGPAIDSIDGLEAWYKIGTAGGRAIRDAKPIEIWEDSSGHGRHLILEPNGAAALYRVRGLNERTVAEVGRSGSYGVKASFELADHTIFLVYATGGKERALLQSTEEGEDHFGIVLRGTGNRDAYTTGRRSFPYNAAVPLGDGFNITVLGRRAGRLKSFINGTDVSSNIELEDPVHVGRFFQISKTRFVRLDGDGLAIAEMVFFGRYLEEQERNAVTRHLSEKYKIGLWNTAEAVRRLGPAVALSSAAGWLTTDFSDDLNVPEPARIAWSVQKNLKTPLLHDAAKDPSRIHCSVDGTRIRLFVTLPMTTSVADADVRVLVLKNEAEYHADETSTGPMPVPGETITAELEVELVLNKGDYVGIVTMAEGVPGKVALETGEAVLGITILDESEP